jgi:drug/metabolite transporter (DMT)-like permease
MAASEWALLVLLSVPWGGSFLFYRMLAAELPPLVVSLGRVGFAAFAMQVILRARGESLFEARKLWPAMLVMGLLNNAIPFTLYAYGEIRVTRGLASILNATTPIVTVLVARLLARDERITRGRAVGVALGFAGVAVLVGPDALAGLASDDLVPKLACLFAPVSYAFAAVYGRRFRGASPLLIATGQVTASALILAPIAAIIDPPWLMGPLSLQGWLAMLGISLICTSFAYVLYFRILATAGPTNLMLVTFLTPITAILLGNLVLGEMIGPTALTGLALIGAGLAAIDGRLPRLAAKRLNGRIAD